MRETVGEEKRTCKNVDVLAGGQLYRASLVPANLSGENPYWDSPYPFYDALFWYVLSYSSQMLWVSD